MALSFGEDPDFPGHKSTRFICDCLAIGNNMVLKERISPKTTPRRKWSLEDANRWAEKYRSRTSILRIAREEGVDPGTVSTWLHRVGIQVKQGMHFVEQPELQISHAIVGLCHKGPEFVRKLVEGRIYGAQVSDVGFGQLQKYCRFIQAYKKGLGVEETASLLGVHRTTIASWRKGTDVPYAVMLAWRACEAPKEGWRWLPTHLDAGGNEQSGWIQVPARIESYSDIVQVVGQLNPLDSTYSSAQRFGLDPFKVDSMRLEMFAYLLGIMLGDAGKLGGVQQRFVSMNLDLQFTKKIPCNRLLGEFVCLCAESMGIAMDSIADKRPSGTSRFGREPSEAFRWSSERSPLLAWIFSVCLGLDWDLTTSTHPVKMRWIFDAPFEFQKRVVQGVADSDATVKPSEVVIASVPNADLLTELLRCLGMSSAHTIQENGRPLRTMVNRRQASTLPIFNEFTKGYRYTKLMKPSVLASKYGKIAS